MNIERRLQHAARELREVPIEVPPLRSRTRRPASRFVPALAVPVLFVAGGLFATGTGRLVEHPTHNDVDSVVEPTPNTSPEPVDRAGTESIGDSVRFEMPPSIDVELEMLKQRSAERPPTPLEEHWRGNDATMITRAGPL